MPLGKAQLNWATGTLVAMASPFASISGSQISLNGKVTGSTVSSAGLVIGGSNINLLLVEFDSLVATVQTQITTNNLTVLPQWEVSDDGTNWATLLPFNGAAYVQWPPTGTGVAATTTKVMSLNGFNPPKRYMRLSVVTGGATGAAADLAIVAYSWRVRYPVQ